MLDHHFLQIAFINGFFVSLACGLVAFLLKVISKSGLIGGVIFGTIIYGCTGWEGFLIPLTFVVIASLATKHGYAKKVAMGIAQEEGGKRGAKHALANILAGTIFAIFSFIFKDNLPLNVALLTAMAGSFATAAADTVSSEMGQIYGRTPINPLTFKRVQPGTEGAVSTEGTLLGILASVIIAIVFITDSIILKQFQSYFHPLELSANYFQIVFLPAICIIIGAFLGNIIESLIGAIGKKLNNELLNFMNTLIGGAIAGKLFYVLLYLFFTEVCVIE